MPDPSFDERPVEELVEEFAWMPTRLLQIHQAFLGRGSPLIAADTYLNRLDAVDPAGH